MFAVVRKSLHLVGTERRWKLWVLVLLALLASALEMAGAVFVFVLMSLVADPAGAIALPLVGDLRQFFDVDETTLLLGVAGGMALFFLLRAVAQVAITYAQYRVAHNAGASLSNRLAIGYLALPYEAHLRRNTADLVRNANNAVMRIVRQAFLPIIRVTADAILTLGLLSVMIVVSPGATLLAVVVVGGAATFLLVVVQPRLKRIGRVSHEMERETIRALQEPLHGLRDIKILGREAFFGRRYGRSRERLSRAMYLRGTIGELPRHVIETALIGFMLGFFALAVLTDAAEAEVLSTLGLFAYAGLRLQPSLNRIVQGLNDLKYSTAAIEEVHDDLLLIDAQETPSDTTPLTLKREIQLQGVTFGYGGSNEDALIDIDLTIRRGQTVGVCGPTGGGKTTLVDVLTGLLSPTHGRVLIDGEDLANRVNAWQATIGVVPQMVFLTDDTLRRNIALGVSDKAVDEDALAEAVRLSQLEPVVKSLPEGLDTVVGERGVRVSGGQRQRVAIARALYRRAEVLFMDEGTSALDNTTESQLMFALESLRGTHTLILVAHRLSTVRACDLLVYVEDGRIAACGAYEDLLRDSPGFRRLATGS